MTPTFAAESPLDRAHSVVLGCLACILKLMCLTARLSETKDGKRLTDPSSVWGCFEPIASSQRPDQPPQSIPLPEMAALTRARVSLGLGEVRHRGVYAENAHVLAATLTFLLFGDLGARYKAVVDGERGEAEVMQEFLTYAHSQFTGLNASRLFAEVSLEIAMARELASSPAWFDKLTPQQSRLVRALWGKHELCRDELWKAGWERGRFDKGRFKTGIRRLNTGLANLFAQGVIGEHFTVSSGSQGLYSIGPTAAR